MADGLLPDAGTTAVLSREISKDDAESGSSVGGSKARLRDEAGIYVSSGALEIGMTAVVLGVRWIWKGHSDRNILRLAYSDSCRLEPQLRFVDDDTD